MEQQRRPQAQPPQWLDRPDSNDDRRSVLSNVNGHQNRAPRSAPYQSEALRRWQTDSEGSGSDRHREAHRGLRHYRNDSDSDDDRHWGMRLGHYQADPHRPDPRRRYRHDEPSDSEEEDRRRRARQRERHDPRNRRRRSRSYDDYDEEEAEDDRRRGRTHQTARDAKSPDPRPSEKYTLVKAAKSAMMAGGAEYIRCRAEGGEFGAWNGQKGKRIAVAAVSGSAIGMMRNGRLLNSGKKPYAEAFMTSIYAVDFLKRVLRHTEFGLDAQKEKEGWAQRAQRGGSRRSHSR
ncbi:hypothetical protein EJ03DRAFT_1851 [Teratosphaeria nubilosa]|uniref:Uncharacterized protein n=1 Tax=Teratosphaeria nubilosa TaxID=161662 RepID=A0A6G1LPU8_9PEZI|nr:hypothetical protein EJ03DRAFT_1851 [Teratosphaeria nubilosa]